MPNDIRDNEFAKVIGRAVIDPTFAEKMIKDPEAAATEVGATLEPDQVTAIKDLSAVRLRSVSDIITEQLSELAFVDNQQQQVQAQAD